MRGEDWRGKKNRVIAKNLRELLPTGSASGPLNLLNS
jgi:hypothetical protein